MPQELSDSGTTLPKINYAQAKKDFLQLVDHWLSIQKSKTNEKYYINSKSNYENIIKEILAGKPPRSRVLQYDVRKADGKTILILKKKNQFSPITQVLTWEEMFDIFMPLHEKSGHKGRRHLMSIINKDAYKYPSMCLTFFKRVCNVCNPNYNRELPSKSRVGLVFVINMVQTQIDEAFRYLLIYSDKETNFVILRPLIAKTDIEISTELLKIFTQFGPPETLYIHGYNSDLTQKIDTNLKEMSPNFKGIITEHRSNSFDLPTIVTDKIQDWMNTNKSDIWEVGCSIVQKQMNCEPIHGNSNEFGTPHSLFFNTFISRKRDDTELNNRKRCRVSTPKAAMEVINKEKESQIVSGDVTDTYLTSNFFDLLELDDSDVSDEFLT